MALSPIRGRPRKSTFTLIFRGIMSQPSNPSDGREFERKDILFGARLSVGENTFDSEIVNISFGGAQVRVGRSLKGGDKAVLEIDPFGSFEVEIKWSDGKDAGIKFSDNREKVAELVMAIATYA